MPFLEYKCSGCNLQTISSFDLTDKKHLDCSASVGYWVEIDSCPDNRHDYYTAFLNYLFCPYCGEKLAKTPEEFEGGRTQRAADLAVREPNSICRNCGMGVYCEECDNTPNR